MAAIVAFGGLFASAPSTAAPGWHAVQTQAGGPTSRKVHLYYSASNLRMESEGDTNAMVIHLPTGNITIIDGAKKIYTQASLKDLMELRNQMKEEMKKRMAQMPPEVRKNIEKMLADQEAAEKKPLKLKATGIGDKISGLACKYYEWDGPDGTGKACIAKKTPVDTKNFRADAKKLLATMKKAGAGSSAAASLAELQLAEHGFPIKTTRTLEMGPQKMELVTTLDSIKNEDVPNAKMTAPKGFKKTSFEEFNKLQQSMMQR